MVGPTSLAADAVGSLDLSSLHRRYHDGTLTPDTVIDAVFARIRASGDDRVWIHRLPEATVRERAAALAALAPAERARLPLFGIPIAVKDNIDAAGCPTTAGCPAFAYAPAQSATALERLLAAGAILIGKTNLDQFATGLVGVRSPYGVARNPFDPRFIPGGSSSGSAVAVAAGLVSLALGTDTAGSGRIPAAFTNIVGLKPTRGRVSAAGVVPACRSLDCVSMFALTVEDAMAALAVMEGSDPRDPYSRAAPRSTLSAGRRIGIPAPEHRRFFGNIDAERLFTQAAERLTGLGFEVTTIDLAPFMAAADLLYGGPWVAERTAAVGDFLRDHPDAVLPVTAGIIADGHRLGAVDAFRAFYRLEELRRQTETVWQGVDLLLVPTAGTIYTIAEVEADPVQLNTNLGAYTNFVNLLDLCGIAVPNGFQGNGLPAGITLLAPAFHDATVAAVAAAFHRAAGVTLGATGQPLPPAGLRLLVVGGHLSGQPLNHQITELGGRLVETCRTAPVYRLHALPGTPARPGLVRTAGHGHAIEGEIWELPADGFGRFIAAIPPPLGVGSVDLADGRRVSGFLCESYAVEGTEDISRFGGWRSYRAEQTAAP